MIFRRGRPNASESPAETEAFDEAKIVSLDGHAAPREGDDPPPADDLTTVSASSELPKGNAMSTPPTKPPATGFVPEIPRRAVDIPGSPVRRPGPPPSQAGRGAGEQKRLQVGKDISLSGEITACDTLVVEGTVDAKLENSQLLEITESGTFRGPVRIEEASIAGTYEGDLTVRGTLSIKATGSVRGTIRYGRLEVEMGGVIRGDAAPLEDDAEA